MSVSSSTPVVTGTITPSFATPFFPSTRQEPSQTSTPVANDDGPPGISKSSSLLFGFLVTFLVLFVAFMACGMSSRRAMERRRRRGLAGLANGADLKQTELHRPPLWDVWISSGKACCWRDMMPLSAKLIHRNEVLASPRPEEVTDAANTTAPQAATVTSPIAMASPDYFPTYIASGRGIARVAGTPAFLNQPRRSPTQRNNTTTNPSNSNQAPQNSNPRIPPTERSVIDEFIRPMQASWALLLQYLHLRSASDGGRVRDDRATSGPNGEGAEEPVDALRVSVLIAMPLPPRSSKSVSGIDDEPDVRGLSGEFALGVQDVPWDDGKVFGFGEVK